MDLEDRANYILELELKNKLSRLSAYNMERKHKEVEAKINALASHMSIYYSLVIAPIVIAGIVSKADNKR